MKCPGSSSGGISPALRWYRSRAAEFKQRGLTTKGTRFKRTPNAGTRKALLALRRERGLAAWNRRVLQLRARGLTTRGTPRILAVRRGDALLLRDDLDALAFELSKCFDHVSPAAQARLLGLETVLSRIRCQLL